MKKIPCNYFGEGQFIFFNIARLAQLEQVIGVKAMELATTAPGLTEVLHALSIGLAHEQRRTPDWYAARMDELFEHGDVTFDDLATMVLKALIGSGLLGKKAYAAAFPEEVTEAEKAAIEAEDEQAKN